MSHHAWIHRGWPRPTCLPPARSLRNQPRGLLRTLSRLHSPHRNLTSHCCSCGGGDIATTAPGSSRPGGSRGGRAEGSSMVMGGGGVRRWFEEALGQRLNLAAAASSFRVVATEEGRRLAIPHVWAPDIRWVDWRELKRLGFRGVVFDKDNTLTAPYSLSLWPPISASFADCVAAFPGRLAVFSNSAGLYQYDPDGSKAKALEDSIGGIHVIRHEMKKPAGSVEDIEKYFGCSASYLIMQVRKLERHLVSRWCKKGLKPPNHSLLLECKQWHVCCLQLQQLQALVFPWGK